MDHTPTSDQWVWVLIQDPDGDEQIVGQHDEENSISFIPTFLEKDAALKCYHFLTCDPAIKNEFQAIAYKDLSHHAAENGFMIFLLSAAGEILEKITPQPDGPQG